VIDVSDTQPKDTSGPPPITSRAEFSAALRWGFEQAIAGGARRIACVDASFAEWPLDDPALHAELAAWLRLPQRRLVLLAADYAAVPRRHPRFVAWRALWAHAIEAWSPPEGDAMDLPTLLVDDRAVSVQLHDAVHWRGRAALDARGARLKLDEIDALLQRSQPAFPVNSLGL
jgi:hypothetical protein